MNIEKLDDKDLMDRYVAVCNAAMLSNAERFPFKQILDAASKSLSRRLIEVEIADDATSDSFVFTFKNGRIQSKPHEKCKSCHCDGKWSVSKPYLEDVVFYSQIYIANPARLDWSWVYNQS